ncbi:hypothetical protein D3C87_1855240 [compost metagenome]
MPQDRFGSWTFAWLFRERVLSGGEHLHHLLDIDRCETEIPLSQILELFSRHRHGLADLFFRMFARDEEPQARHSFRDCRMDDW